MRGWGRGWDEELVGELEWRRGGLVGRLEGESVIVVRERVLGPGVRPGVGCAG